MKKIGTIVLLFCLELNSVHKNKQWKNENAAEQVLIKKLCKIGNTYNALVESGMPEEDIFKLLCNSRSLKEYIDITKKCNPAISESVYNKVRYRMKSDTIVIRAD